MTDSVGSADRTDRASGTDRAPSADRGPSADLRQATDPAVVPEPAVASDPAVGVDPADGADRPSPASSPQPPRVNAPVRPAMPGAPGKKPMDFRRSSLRLLREMRTDRALLVGALVSGAVSVGFAVLTPRILGHVTDLVVTGAAGNRGVDFAEIGRVLLGVGVMVLLSVTFAAARGRLAANIASRTAFRLREQATTKLHRLPLRYFDQQPRGEVLSRVTNDIDNIAQTLQQVLTRMVAALLTVVGVLVMMLLISPLLTLVAILTVLAAASVTKGFGKRAQPHFVKQWGATGRLNAHIEEMYSGHALVKVFGRQREARQAFDERNDELFTAAYKAQFISGVIEPAMAFIGHLNYILVAVIGGLRVASGTMTVGDIQAFISYTLQFNHPISQMAALINMLQSVVASAERVFDLLDAEEQDPEPAVPTRPDRVTGRVGFHHVSFRYEPDKPLIEDLSLTVEPNHTVAIVGPTGAGKTTLVNLLMRFYEVTGGRITLDGVDIAAMSREELRGLIGMVLQDTWLFGGTIAENIAYGADGASREEIVEAARATHADRFIRTLPDGYDTVIDDEGSNLSAGEKQLITIARAFLTRPAILVLDEATSSVDTRTEMLVQRAMNSLQQGRTSFVIAHRLSTIRNADVILVMDSGRIVEHGTHKELLAADGAYARLYTAQFAQPVTAGD